jgi:hypothetical protein
LTPFKKKSYLSLSTDYTYKFLVNDRYVSEVSPGDFGLAAPGQLSKQRN